MIQEEDKLVDDQDLADEIEACIGSLEDLKTPTENKDWQQALEQASDLQYLIERIHTYISEKVNGN